MDADREASLARMQHRSAVQTFGDTAEEAVRPVVSKQMPLRHDEKALRVYVSSTVRFSVQVWRSEYIAGKDLMSKTYRADRIPPESKTQPPPPRK